MKTFYVGVKAIIHDEDRGYLLLKHKKGHWDVPGGRIEGDDGYEETIIREFSEEIPGTKFVAIKELLGTHRLPEDIDNDISLVLLYFLVEARIPKEVLLSEEHKSFVWVKEAKDIPEENLNTEIKKILAKILE